MKIDEILSDDTILLNEALAILQDEIENLDMQQQNELTEDLLHAIYH